MLIVDIGNTNVSMGVSAGSGYDDLYDGMHFATDTKKVLGDWLQSIMFFSQVGGLAVQDREECLDSVAIASVVPPVETVIAEAFDCLGVRRKMIRATNFTKIKHKVDDLSKVGVDRVANVIAANELHKQPDQSMVIFDLGTATTVDYVDKDGVYGGGMILPGLSTSFEALFEKAYGLKDVNVFGEFENMIGTNTSEALRSGARYGFSSQIDGLCFNIAFMTEQNVDELTIVLTGGLADFVFPNCNLAEVYDPRLTTYGIKLMSEDCDYEEVL